MILTVGLTGGIGSGKTIIGEVFRHIGVPVFEADDAGKKILDTDQDVMDKIAAIFGPHIIKNGCLDRSLIAQEVFRNADLLSKLNDIIHPRVRHAFREWTVEQSSSPYVIMEAAIIFESGADQYLHTVIAVSAPVDLRIQRVVERDRVAADSVRMRMKNQWPETSVLEKAEHVIINDGTRLVLPQVLAVHELLLKKSKGISGHM